MKQYAWKAWKKKPKNPLDSYADAPINNSNKQDSSQKSNDKQNKNPKKKSNKKPSKKSNEKPNKKRKTEPKPLDEMIKGELINELEREHPYVILNMGTLAANARTVSLSEGQIDLSSEVIRCVKEAAGHAAVTKRLCQRLIGQFLEFLFYQGMCEETDREWLDLLCPRVQDEDSDDEEEEDEAQEEEEEKEEEEEEEEKVKEESEEKDKGKEATVEIEADVLADNQCQFFFHFAPRTHILRRSLWIHKALSPRTCIR